MNFLVDTGCNTSMLSNQMSDRLTECYRRTLGENNKFDFLADRSKLAFYGVNRLTGQIRDVKMKDSFVINQINNDAILGMPFLHLITVKWTLISKSSQ